MICEFSQDFSGGPRPNHRCGASGPGGTRSPGSRIVPCCALDTPTVGPPGVVGYKTAIFGNWRIQWHCPAWWPHQVPLRARPRLPQIEVYSSEHPQELCRPPGLSLASRAPLKTQTSPPCQGRRTHPRGVAEVHVEHCPTARIVPRNAPMYGTRLLTQRCRENRNALSKAQVSNIPDNTFCKLESFPKSTFF